MDKPQDRRVQRTRQTLRAALVELILENGYEDISVQDIVERGNIGRSTFYMHYSGKQAVFSDSFRGLELSLKSALEQDAPRSNTAALLPYGGLLIAHVAANRRLYRALAGQRGGVLAAAHIRKILFDLVRRDFADRMLAGGRDEADRNAAVEFVVGAFIGVLSWWLDHKTGWDSEQLDAFVNRMIAPGLGGLFVATDQEAQARHKA